MDAEEAAVAAPEAVAQQLQAQLDELKDRYLRTAAEYDNFRKRTAKERSEMWQRAQAAVVSNIVDALDDFGRVLDVDPETASAGDVIKGVELVERKLLRELETAGLERVGQVGEAFDPNHHEAIGSLPAESEEQDHTVGTIIQVGYRFGGTLIRPARVQVLMWAGDGGEGPV
jgi:molecular chaperone GrpE